MLGLQVVLADGTVVRLGGPRLKDVAGLSLTKLFVGSEGTLGVITEVTLRLLPPQHVASTVVATFDSVEAAANAVVLGQADAMSADSPVTGYAIAQTDGKLEAAGEVFDSAPYGFPVEKGSKLADAVQAAMQSLIDDGTYADILAEWGVEAGGVDTIEINAGT